jgi:pimeloyl-ACP methyl ester carboxylesterase
LKSIITRQQQSLAGPIGEPILLLPGMGADHRLFDSLRPWIRNIVVPHWLPPEGCRSIRDYALKLMRELPELPSIIGGASFGGAVALELAHLVKPRCLILLGAPARREEIRWQYRAMAAALTPRQSAKLASQLARFPFGQGLLFGPKTRRQLALFRAMIEDTPSERLAWMAESLLKWESPGLPDCRVHRVHGTADLLIRTVSHRVHWVEGGGHAFTVTHPAATGRILQKLIRREFKEGRLDRSTIG